MIKASMFKLIFKRSVKKDINKTNKEHLQNIAHTINSLKNNPFPEDVKKIKGGSNPYYRIRQGSYRIAYRIDLNIRAVEIVFIKRRNEKTYR